MHSTTFLKFKIVPVCVLLYFICVHMKMAAQMTARQIYTLIITVNSPQILTSRFLNPVLDIPHTSTNAPPLQVAAPSATPVISRQPVM